MDSLERFSFLLPEKFQGRGTHCTKFKCQTKAFNNSATLEKFINLLIRKHSPVKGGIMVVFGIA